MQKRQIPEKGFASIKNDITGSELASGIVDTLRNCRKTRFDIFLLIKSS